MGHLFILNKAVTPDNVNIQLEDWGEEEYMIGTYPIARNFSKSNIIRKDETFRASLRFEKGKKGQEEALRIFEELKSGAIRITELEEDRFYDKRSLYYLGLIDYEPAV